MDRYVVERTSVRVPCGHAWCDGTHRVYSYVIFDTFAGTRSEPVNADPDNPGEARQQVEAQAAALLGRKRAVTAYATYTPSRWERFERWSDGHGCLAYPIALLLSFVLAIGVALFLSWAADSFTPG